jgi:hypothetical protein
MSTKPLPFCLFALLVAALPAAQAQRPASWRVRPDTPGPDSAVAYVTMPPGWHITTGPAALLYDPANAATGRFAVEAEIFLFPGQSQEGYGLFLGGTDLEGGSPSWIAFLVRRDGGARIEQRTARQTTPLVEAVGGNAVKPHPGEGTAKNVLRVSVEPDSIRFEANGSRIATLPRGELPLDGIFGFRIGAGNNMHVSQLDVIRRLAPAPVPK